MTSTTTGSTSSRVTRRRSRSRRESGDFDSGTSIVRGTATCSYGSTRPDMDGWAESSRPPPAVGTSAFRGRSAWAKVVRTEHRVRLRLRLSPAGRRIVRRPGRQRARSSCTISVAQRHQGDDAQDPALARTLLHGQRKSVTLPFLFAVDGEGDPNVASSIDDAGPRAGSGCGRERRRWIDSERRTVGAGLLGQRSRLRPEHAGRPDLRDVRRDPRSAGQQRDGDESPCAPVQAWCLRQRDAALAAGRGGLLHEVAGLGASPTDVTINGKIEVYNRCLDGGGTSNRHALVNFWRIASRTSP